MFITSTLFSQALTLDAKNSSFKISGTSTMHDWEMTAKEMNGNAQVALEDNVLKAINSLRITVPVQGLQSGKNLMDTKTYSAFNSDKHPNVSFVLKRVTSISPVGQNYMVRATGDLTMNGQTKTIQVMAACGMINGVLTAKGSQLLNMTDYGMEPPTAMMGSVKTGAEVSVMFDVRFK
jgi:polyisoprenoid-binding protein YceI